MYFSELTTSGAIPALTATLQFAARRHEMLASNVANLNTPNYQPRDVQSATFQEALGKAIDVRRDRFGGARGDLDISSSRSIGMDRRGNLRLNPNPSNLGPLRHDRNNSSIDETMQAIAENTMVYRMSAELLQGHFKTLRTAIAGRI